MRPPTQGTQQGNGPEGQTAPAPRAKPAGSAAQVALVSCTTGTVKGKTRKHCATTLLKRTVAIKASPKSAKASLERTGEVYATGKLTRTQGSLRLVLNLRRRETLPSGSYTLALSWNAGKTTRTSRQRIRLE